MQRGRLRCPKKRTEALPDADAVRMNRKPKDGRREGNSSRALMRRTATRATLMEVTGQRDAVQKLLVVICCALQLGRPCDPVVSRDPCCHSWRQDRPNCHTTISREDQQSGLLSTPARFQMCVLPAWIWTRLCAQRSSSQTPWMSQVHSGEDTAWTSSRKARRCSPPWSFD